MRIPEGKRLATETLQVTTSVHPGEEKKNLRTDVRPSTPPTPVFAGCPSERGTAPRRFPLGPFRGESEGKAPSLWRGVRWGAGKYI